MCLRTIYYSENKILKKVVTLIAVKMIERLISSTWLPLSLFIRPV